MHNFLSFTKEFRIPKKKELRNTIKSFSQKELVLFLASVSVAFIAFIFILQKINTSFMVTIPDDGGTLTEGIIGMPTLVNPVLALSDADKDLTALVYSGLMRKMPDSTFIPDLAESYTISPDGKIYTFVMKKNAVFHDGQTVKADDVIFTINKIKDVLIKSPRKNDWDGTTVEKTDDYTIVFTLKKPYISFMDNTTIGILPSHIWKDITEKEFSLSSLNIKAVGSGPYKIDTVIKNKDNIPQEYKLKRFLRFTLGKPHIKNINIISFANEKDLIRALVSNSIDQASGLSPENTKSIEDKGYTLYTATLPRLFGLFFNNTNNKILADSTVIKAMDLALDRQDIVNQVLSGYGTVIKTPVSDTILKDENSDKYAKTSTEEANTILDKAGWTIGTDGVRAIGGTKTVTQTKKVGKKTVTQQVKVNTGAVTRLSFSLTTGDTPELAQASELIKRQLELIGAEVTIKVYSTGELNSKIRARDYEALFFGQVINHESDLFSFWHSSQKADPGLNIGMYSNTKVDTLLQTAQDTQDSSKRDALYKDFIAQFNKDLPSLLIYSPKYLYATNKKLNYIYLDTLTIPSDRFVSVHTWYADTDHVWKIFTKSPATSTAN